MDDTHTRVRLSVRALLVEERRLLLVNAYPSGVSDLWCAPGGGAEAGASLADNLVREVHEETGLTIRPGPLVAVSEFHNPDDGFHQCDLFFLVERTGGALSAAWQDPDGVVDTRGFFDQATVASLRVKPAFLADLPFRATADLPAITPTALERMVR